MLREGNRSRGAAVRAEKPAQPLTASDALDGHGIQLGLPNRSDRCTSGFGGGRRTRHLLVSRAKA